MPTYKQSGNFKEVKFDTLEMQDFDVVGALGAGVALTTIQAILPIPYDIKIYKVGIATTGTAVGAVTFNIVAGTGAAGAVGTIDVNAPVNTSVFSVAPTFTASGASAGQIQTFIPDVPDCIYPSSTNSATTGFLAPSPAIVGNMLTLRMTTGTSLGGLTKVIIACKPVNQHRAATMNPTPAGNVGWDPSCF